MSSALQASLPDPPFSIAIDARPMAGPPCGYTIYLASVMEALRPAGLRLTLLSNRPLLPGHTEASGLDLEVFGALGDLRWEQRSLPEFLEARRFDVYFSGANRGMPWRKTPGTRYVLGLLDIIPYLFFRDYYVRRWRRWIGSPDPKRETAAQLIALARADAILTISRQSAADIRRVFRRRAVTSNLIRLKDVPTPVRGRVIKPQFVYVGGIDARKKVDVLLRAFALLLRRHPDHRLVLIGSNYAACLPLVDELGIADRVDLTGYVDHDTKFRIIAESQAMVYPSLYEGYGLAIAEGFQASIPVIAGRGGSQGEIGGAGTRPIDPSSPDDVAAAMEDMLDPAVRAAWIARGQEQLAILTDPAIEDSLVAFFREQARLARTIARADKAR